MAAPAKTPVIAKPTAGKPNKSAKIASNAGGDVAVHLTRRTCAHCGERIPADKVLSVKRSVIHADGSGPSRMAYFIKGHETR